MTASTEATPTRELLVLSGKGGTGKTSLVASFAVLAQHAVLADCDVDAADLYLLLSPSVNQTEQFLSGIRSQPETAGGILSISDYKPQPVLLA